MIKELFFKAPILLNIKLISLPENSKVAFATSSTKLFSSKGHDMLVQID